MNKKIKLLLVVVLGICGACVAKSPEVYNVVWNSPSTYASGQMPLGNGDIAAGAYAIEDGDLYLLLSKNDAFTYLGDLFKTGRVRVSLNPNPFVKGKPFKQTMDMATGSVQIEADGVKLKIWADANRNLYHIEIDSPKEIAVTAAPEFWERFDVEGAKWSKDPRSKTQDVRVDRNGKILWYFAVGDRSSYLDELKAFNVEHMAEKIPDPYRFNTFGNLLESPDLQLKDGGLRGAGTHFDIRIHALAKQAPEVANWIDTIEKQAAVPVDIQKDWQAHVKWWSNFWDRSWIVMSDNTVPADQRWKLNGDHKDGLRVEKDSGAVVGQSYTVFRYLMGCQSRGKVQVKFNGGIFTQPLYGKTKEAIFRLPLPHKELGDGAVLTHEDDRAWGRRFTFQNQRLLYWSLLMSGDADLMKPFFDFYWNTLPVRKEITKTWFGHEGTCYRENTSPTGGEPNSRHLPRNVAPYSIDCNKYRDMPKAEFRLLQQKGKELYDWNFLTFHFVAGLETVAMMIDHVNYTGDADFRENRLVPFANEILTFFDKHYIREANGKLRLDPSMVLETWHCAVNPAPDIAGLLYDLQELIKMKAGTPEDQAFWKRFLAEIPPVHIHEIDGRKAIAPAYEWGMKSNHENGLLYPVFPFRLYGVAHGSKDLVEWTLKHRTSQNAYEGKCWTQDQIHFACGGDAASAKDGLIHRYTKASKECRFPVYGSSEPDSCPDFDHFGSGNTALQRMLVQEANGKIFLLPAWPKEWNVDFKLHLEKQTTITGSVKDGKLVQWEITPASRRKDVVVMDIQ